MPPDQLAALAAVISEGSFEAAATRLHVTPSAISQRIKALEHTLGRVLVERSKPVRATADGEVLLRAQRQIDWIHQETTRELNNSTEPRNIPLAINSDSLATWALEALARLTPQLDATFRILREDEGHSLDLLRTGEVLGAVSGYSEKIPGCETTELGEMTYQAVASPSFIKTYFKGEANRSTLARAPVVYFDRKDKLQSLFLARFGRDLAPPRHDIPGSTAYVDAVRLGMGWGLVPTQQLAAMEPGTLEPIVPSGTVSVRLYWTRWKVASALMEEIGREFASALSGASNT